ncbi:MAG TPA: Nramp family divalent metal transporter [Patescibacteria group bacterium]|nr:Nramp family divalent metal transporter [Patescibacteria group bacterium]
MVQEKIERVAGAPAAVLDQAINLSKQAKDRIGNQQQIKRGREYWENLGPGWTTGASDDDPSGIATYSQAGATYGFQLLWLAAFTFPLMAVVQEMCARIGLVTGQGLAANIRDYFPRWVLYSSTILLLIANIFNIGADLGAMSKAVQLLRPGFSFGSLVLGFAIISLGLQIFIPYEKYAKYLKFLALILFSYVLTALIINLNWNYILTKAVMPSLSFSKDQIILVCGVLGTTISPYLFFWQTSQEVEEEILKGKETLKQRQRETSAKEIKNMRIDVWTGMFVSNLIMFFIIVVCAAILNANGITNITTAASAAAALRPLAGQNAYLLFTLGIIGTGLLAVPILAGSASYALSESFGWTNGLHRELKEANAFYGVIIIAMMIGLVINFVGLDPIKALIYSAVINGMVAPVILVTILLLSNNKKIMGDHVSGKFTLSLGWVITIIMILAGIGTVLSPFLP